MCGVPRAGKTAPVPAAPVQVLVVDDDERFTQALRWIFEADGRAEAIGTAANGQLAIAEALRLTPDVVTMDIDMPVMDGVEATRLIVAYAKVPVVLVTGSESSVRVTDAMAAGARAYLPKQDAADKLVDLLLAVVSGR